MLQQKNNVEKHVHQTLELAVKPHIDIYRDSHVNGITVIAATERAFKKQTGVERWYAMNREDSNTASLIKRVGGFSMLK